MSLNGIKKDTQMQDKTQQLLLDTAVNYGEIIYKDNKILAKVDFLRLWSKNPKVADEEDLSRLKKQILELNVYKPLVVCLGDRHGLILGGNQRYKVLKELVKEDKRFEYAWISLVEAPTDEDKFKYAISDNDMIGKYDRAKILEAMPMLAGQKGMFKEYEMNFGNSDTIEKIKSEINLTEEELKIKKLQEDMRSMGVNEESIEAIKDITNYHKNKNILPDIDLKGEQTSERFPVMFWYEDAEEFKIVSDFFKGDRKYNYDSEKLLNIAKGK